MSRARAYVFTLNNYTDAELVSLRVNGADSALRYLIFGKEVASSGTPHLQGYCEFQSAKTLSAVKRFFGVDRIHLEARRGTAAQAADYCKKEQVRARAPDYFNVSFQNFEEFGTLSAQGKRNDLSAVRQVAMDGGMKAVVLGDFNYQVCFVGRSDRHKKK